MEKIILRALELAGYKNADVIAEIISCTPNPQVAAEMVLGVYTPREDEPCTDYRKRRYSNTIAVVSKYNDLANLVEIVTYNQKTKTVYYATKSDYDNKVYQDKRPEGNYYTTGKVETTGIDEELVTMSIENFESDYSTKMSLEEVDATFKDWLSYQEVKLSVEEAV